MLLQSLGVAAGAAFLAVLAGTVVAVATVGSGRRWAFFWGIAGVVVLALPQFVAASAWLEWATRWRIGPTGSVGPISYAATAVALASLLWPIAAGLIYSAWRRHAPALLEVEPRMREVALFKGLLLRLAVSAMAASACLCFALALANFTIPTLFQVPVFTEQVWLAFNVRLDVVGALKNAVPSLVVALALVFFCGLWGDFAWPAEAAEASDELLRQRLGRIGPWAIVGGLVVVAMTLVWPVFVWLGAERTWLELGSAWAAGRPASVRSFLNAASAASVALALGVAIASWVRRFGARGSFFAQLTWFPFLVPGVVLGIVVNQTVSPWSGGSELPVIVSLVVRYLGFAVAGMVSVLQSLDRAQSDSLRLISGSWWRYWRVVVWPQAGARVAAVWYIAYLLCLWDVETITLVAPPGGETLAIRIFNLLHYGHAAQVKALCVILTGLGLLPGVIFQLVSLTARGRMGHTTSRDS